MGFSIDTPIATTLGWKKIQDVQAGDLLFAADGCPTLVVETDSITTDSLCFEITFSDNKSLKVSSDQPFLTWPYKARWALGGSSRRTTHKPRRVFPEKMATTLIYGGRRPDHGIMIGQALQYDEKELLIHPYVLGAWLGDGDSTGARFSTNDIEIIEYIRQAGYPARKSTGRDPYLWLLTDGNDKFGKNNPKLKDCLASRLRKLDVINNKHVPDIYMQGSIHQRTLLLQGLMDTDGSVDPLGHCEFGNTNRAISEAVCELVISLGGKASLVKAKAQQAPDGRIWKNAYIVSFTPIFPVFRLLRKLNRQKWQNFPVDRIFRYVTSVQQISSVPIKNLYLENKDSLFLIGEQCIPVYGDVT